MPTTAPAVLLVDDDLDFLEDLRALVHGSLPRVPILTASSGAQALDLLAKHDVAAIVADQQMPGMDGIELLTRAQQRFPRVPRIMLTGFPGFDLAMEALDGVHVHDFVPKPPDAARLIQAIRRAMIDHTIQTA